MEWRKLKSDHIETGYEGAKIHCPNCGKLLGVGLVVSGQECFQCGLDIEIGIRFPSKVNLDNKTEDGDPDSTD